MPKYSYYCDSCRMAIIGRRSVEDRRRPAVCPGCGGAAPFVFSSQVQLITRPVAFQDGNKFALGFSEKERLETMKADDLAYEANWAGAETGVRRVTAAEALRKQSLNEVFSTVS